jgi:cysteine-rich repeat protein
MMVLRFVGLMGILVWSACGLAPLPGEPLGCGDGFVEEGVEACDDNNNNETDDCAACQVARCGDGFVQAGVEGCDDGNDNPTDDCVACQIARCGDGFVQAGVEACDDGNQDARDGCGAACQIETPGWVNIGRQSVPVIVGCCSSRKSSQIPCQSGPVNGAGATVGDQLVVADGNDVESKANVVESGFIQGFSGRRISDSIMEITGADGCGCDRPALRSADVWECRY